MKKRTIIGFLTVLLMTAGMFAVSFVSHAGATEEDYLDADVQIGSAEQLLSFANEAKSNTFAGKKILLTQDITLPDGAVWPAIQNFCGTFDGNGHSISNLHMLNLQTSSYQGPAGIITSTGNGAVIRNLILKDSTITSWFNTAPIVGRIAGETLIENVHVESSVTVTGTQQIGGVVGRMNPFHAVIRNTSSAATLVLDDVGTISKTTGNAYEGGIVGDVRGDIVLDGCAYYGRMDVSASSGIGGLIGCVYTGVTSVEIRNSAGCPQADSVTYYDAKVGGFIGASHMSSAVVKVERSYASVTAAYKNASAGLVGGSTYYLRTSRSDGIDYVGVPSPGVLTALGLAGVNENFSGKTVRLTSDLDFSAFETFPGFCSGIAGSGYRFNGTLDGAGHTISNLRIERFRKDYPNMEIYAGLVPQLEYAGIVKDLTITKSIISSDAHGAGAVSGRIANGGTVERVHVTDSVSVSGEFSGGIAGRFGAANTSTGITATVRECWVEAEITGSTYAGGIAGYNQARGSYVEYCYFSGSVTANGACAGMIGHVNAGGFSMIGCVGIGTIGTDGQGAGVLAQLSYLPGQGNGYSTNSPDLAAYSYYSVRESYFVAPTFFGFRNADRQYNFSNEVLFDSETFSSVEALKEELDPDFLDPDYWTMEAGEVPMLNAFLGSEKPAGTPFTAPHGNIEGYLPSLQECFAFVPVPELQSFASFSRGFSNSINAFFIYTTVTEAEYNTYLVKLQEAGFSIYSGSNYMNPSSGRYIVPSYNSEKQSMTLSSYPGPRNQLSTANNLFAGLPTLSGTPHTVDSGGNQYTRTYANQPYSEYVNYMNELEALGFEKIYDNSDGLDGGNLLEAVYRKGSRDVIVTYVRTTSVLYVIVTLDQVKSPALYRAASYPTRFSNTVLFMPALKQKSLSYQSAAGNSFIIRLKNGHFLVNDGGNTIETEEFLNYLKDMAPAGEIPVVEGWFISHPHGDHYGVLHRILNDASLRTKIRVNGLYGNFPSLAAIGALGDEYTNYMRFVNCAAWFRNAEGGACEYYTVHSGDVYSFCDVQVEIPVTQDLIPRRSEAMKNYYGSEAMWRVDDLNDSSSWIKVIVGDQSILLGGDADQGETRFLELSYSASYLTVTFMNLLHHGYNILQHFKVKTVNSTSLSRSYTTNVLFHVTTMLYDNEDQPPEATDRFYGVWQDAYHTRANQFIPYIEKTLSEHFSYTEGSRVFTFPYTVGTSELYSDWILTKLGDMNGDKQFTLDDVLFHAYTFAFPKWYTTLTNRDTDRSGSTDLQDTVYLLYALYFPESYRLSARPDFNW